MAMPDTSGPGPTALQEPASWAYDFDPATGSSRASYPGEVNVAGNIGPWLPLAGGTTGPLNIDAIASPAPALIWYDNGTPPFTPGFGGALSFNCQGGATEVDFINLYPTAAYSFMFWQIVANGTLTVVATILPNGSLSLPGGLVGTGISNNAAAGQVGEYISGNVTTPGVTLTSITPANVTSISLTAGDWDVNGTVSFISSGNNISQVGAWISTVSATAPANLANNGGLGLLNVGGAGANTYFIGGSTMPTGTMRLSLAVTTTVYLCAQTTFVSGTASAFGFIRARRMR